MKHMDRQRGLALVLALLVVAIVAALALLFVQRQQLWMRQLKHRAGFSSATTAVFVSIDMVRLTLRDDARKNQVDHMLEPWTIPIPPIAIEEGRVSGQIVEQQGRYNLTNLLPAQGAKIDEAAVQRAANGLGVNASLLTRVLTAWQDLRKREPGAEPELMELLEIVRPSSEDSQRLQRHVVLLPERTQLNVNFATAEALMATIPGLNSSDASSILSRRTGNPFRSVAAFTAVLPESLRQQATAFVSVQSRYFLVEVQARFDRVQLGYEALLRRDGRDLPVLLWARRAAPADN
ncbi:MAG: hypothetical protein CGU28_09400 [Candidatus Dactylopiibacterium carminicum]|nr:MAG: hypothetical protein CGU28_09400 [Candidatus Dactylopiibacterium carminicum]